MNDKIRCTVGLSVERDGERVLDLSIGPVATRQEIQAAMRNLRNLLNKYGPAPEASKPEMVGKEPFVTPAAPPPVGLFRGAKGFLILHCDGCGTQFTAFPKDFSESILCKCGHIINLTVPLARFEYECSTCDRTWRGKTNSTLAELNVKCKCGRTVPLVWNKNERFYKGKI